MANDLSPILPGARGVTIDPATRIVRVGASTQKLEPQAFRVLQRLIAAGGAVVSRDDLLQDCWGPDSGSDEALSQAVAQIRRALDDDPASPRHIRTIPKRGYRWLGDGGELERPARDPAFMLQLQSPLAFAIGMMIAGALIATLVIELSLRRHVELKIVRHGPGASAPAIDSGR